MRTSPSLSRPATGVLLGLALVAALSAACQRKIGDGCAQDTDCSINADRRCDLSQSGGYCTLAECEPDSCPDNAACVEFLGEEPRLARRFCMSTCSSDGDCRSGYECREAANACPMISVASGDVPMCARKLDVTRTASRFCVQKP